MGHHVMDLGDMEYPQGWQFLKALETDVANLIAIFLFKVVTKIVVLMFWIIFLACCR